MSLCVIHGRCLTSARVSHVVVCDSLDAVCDVIVCLQGPLRWSRQVSGVSIPNYRGECRALGDPLLFTKSQRLATALVRREEFLMDTQLATHSYHVSASKQ